MTRNPATSVPPRWLHGLAWLTVCATLPLLFSGASVTSFDVGMVDPEGYRHPWVILRVLFENNGFDWLLEYGHRALGFLVGLCGIALAIGFAATTTGRMRWLGAVALALIVTQGLLGRFRVDYNAAHGRSFALVHGCFAQIVFATLVYLVAATSKRWQRDSLADDAPVSPQLQRWSILTMLVVFAQLILGGFVRHKSSLVGPRGHLLGAFVVVVVVGWLAKLVLESESRKRFMGTLVALGLLIGVQVVLGTESWLAKFFVPDIRLESLAPVPVHSQWIRSAHYLVGTLIFAHAVLLALKANLQPSLADSKAADLVPSSRTLEGVA